MKPNGLSWLLYLRNGLGRRISLLGERVGCDSLIYNPLVMLHVHDAALADAPRVIPPVLQTLPRARRFLDVGAGSGAYAAELRRRGREVVALERSRYGRALAKQQGVDCRAFDLRKAVPAEVEGIFDLVFCFEVAEHLRPALGEKLIRFMASFRAPVLFSAAHPGQGGSGHVNEQPPEYWMHRFKQLSFAIDVEATATLRAAFTSAGTAKWFETNAFGQRQLLVATDDN